MLDGQREHEEFVDEVTGEVIAEYLEEDPSKVETTARERFVVDSEEKFAWVARRLKAIVTRQNRTREAAAAEAERITAFANRKIRTMNGEAEFFRGLLLEYMRKENERDPKIKTIESLDATATARKTAATVTYDDAEMLKYLGLKSKNPSLMEIGPWLETIGPYLDPVGKYIRITVEPDRARIKSDALDGTFPNTALVTKIDSYVKYDVKVT